MKRLIILLGISLFSVVITITVKADSPVTPISYEVECVDGEHIFVMFSPSSYGEDPIRDKYPTSGLYQKDNKNEPIYWVNWYSYSVNLSEDCQYVVQWGPWPLRGHFSELAVAFHQNGQLMKSYSVSDLVEWPIFLPRTVSHYRWEATAEFDEINQELFVRTVFFEEYLFDITTGEIIRSNFIHISNAVNVLLFGSLIGLGRILLKKMKSQPDTNQGN